MKTKQMIGLMLVCSPFLGLFVYMINMGGIRMFLEVSAICTAIVVPIVSGVWLISSNKFSGDEFEEHY